MEETIDIVRVSLAIKHHLSSAMIDMDVQQEVYQEQAKERLRFVKYLVHMFPDTDIEVDIDAAYQQFKLGERRVAS
jgi:hypothetical protein